MRIYGEITKLDARDDGTLTVKGVASSGAVDAADERVSPAAMKAALPDYMRFGALREMHGLTAAGATLSAQVDTDGLTHIEAHVVDPLAVKKVRLGVYKGFSIGGRVLERDPSDRNLITALQLDEISLVDRPCNPEAVIQMWKADRSASAASPSNEAVKAKALALAIAAGKPDRATEYVVKARQALIDAAATAPAAADTPNSAQPLEIELEKRGARNSALDLARIQAAHDELVALGAKCQSREASPRARRASVDAEVPNALFAGLVPASDNEPLAGKALARGGVSETPPEVDAQIESLRASLELLRKQFEAVAAEPLPPRTLAGWARAVSKAEDASASDRQADEAALRKQLERLTPEERAQFELRAALSRPIAVPGR